MEGKKALLDSGNEVIGVRVTGMEPRGRGKRSNGQVSIVAHASSGDS